MSFVNYPKRTILFCVICAMLCPVAQCSTFVKTEDFDNLRIQLSAQPTVIESRAASLFVQYWEKSTGFRPVYDNPTHNSINIWIGQAAEQWLGQDELAQLGSDGILIRTKRRLRGVEGKGNLLLCGNGSNGVLYSVYEYLEQQLGIRWLTPETEYVPVAPQKIDALNYSHTPPFSYRDVSYPAFVDNPVFAEAHRLNGFFSRPFEQRHYVNGHAGYGHTFHLFVDPEKYFSTNPEYFSEVNGNRIRENTQLCLSNPEVLVLVIEGVKRWLENAEYHERVVSVSQMDWGNPCECAECGLLDLQEGSHAGSIVSFVNKVAEAIEVDYPDVIIDTFAYMYSRKPPLHVRPRHNVQVRLCTLECDFSKPLTTRKNDLNSAFRSDLAGWAAITSHLQIWDYTQNWFLFQIAHPNIHIFAPNLRLFAKYKVEGVFEQASLQTPGADFEYLKGYVLAKLLWDPSLDVNMLRDEFLDLYYGPAAPYLKIYWDTLEKHVSKMETPLLMYNQLDWLDYDLVVRCLDLFGQAQMTAIGDPEVMERLRHAQLAVQTAAVLCPGRVTEKPGGLIIDRPPSLSYQEFWEALMTEGVTHGNDHPIKDIWLRFPTNQPPRHEESQLIKLSNITHEVWVAPGFGGAVLQFRDKNRDIDLLRGLDEVVDYSGRIGFWNYNTDPENQRHESPVAKRLQITTRTDTEVKMRQENRTGVVVERIVRLDPIEPRFEISVRYDALDAVALPILTSLRAQWNTQGEIGPELWVEKENGWQVSGLPEAMGMRDFTILPVDPQKGWGLRLPGKQAGVLCGFSGSEFGWAALRYLPELDEALFEVSPGLVEYAPQSPLIFSVSFTWISEPPK